MKEITKRLNEWVYTPLFKTPWNQATFQESEYFRFGENNILHNIPSEILGRNLFVAKKYKHSL